MQYYSGRVANGAQYSSCYHLSQFAYGYIVWFTFQSHPMCYTPMNVRRKCVFSILINVPIFSSNSGIVVFVLSLWMLYRSDPKINVT